MSTAELKTPPQHGAAETAKAEVPTIPPNASIRSFPLEPQNVLLCLLGFRLLNALTVQTFFQPDEYFQTLEPAWQFAFGEGAGAWITWVR